MAISKEMLAHLTGYNIYSFQEANIYVHKHTQAY